MASFVVETYVPRGDHDRFQVDVDGICAAAASTPTGPARAHHVRSYLAPNDEMAFHYVDAGSAEDVRRLTELAGIEPERIVTVIGIDPPGERTGCGEYAG